MKSAKEWREHFDAGVRGDGNYQLDMENFVEAVREEMRQEILSQVVALAQSYQQREPARSLELVADIIRDFGKDKP